jgi:hypothetical protein
MPGNDWSEFEHPSTDRLIADHQSALSQEILDIPIAQREPEVEPDSMSDDVGRKSVAGIGDGLHDPNLIHAVARCALRCQCPTLPLRFI